MLIAGSIAGFIPGSFQVVYNGSKAFLGRDARQAALQNGGAGHGQAIRAQRWSPRHGFLNRPKLVL